MSPRWGLIVMVFLACSRTAETPTSLSSPLVLEEWAIAQMQVYAFTMDPRVYRVAIETFKVVEVPAEGISAKGKPYFLCSGIKASGCYKPSGRVIEWLAPTVLRHEFGHGLWEVLDIEIDQCNWRNWQHEEECR